MLKREQKHSSKVFVELYITGKYSRVLDAYKTDCDPLLEKDRTERES